MVITTFRVILFVVVACFLRQRVRERDTETETERYGQGEVVLVFGCFGCGGPSGGPLTKSTPNSCEVT